MEASVERGYYFALCYTELHGEQEARDKLRQLPQGEMRDGFEFYLRVKGII